MSAVEELAWCHASLLENSTQDALRHVTRMVGDGGMKTLGSDLLWCMASGGRGTSCRGREAFGGAGGDVSPDKDILREAVKQPYPLAALCSEKVFSLPSGYSS